MSLIAFLENALLNTNAIAMTKTISLSEGTDAPDGYNYLFGSNPNNTRRFTDFSHHPNLKFPFGQHGFSDAAGKYQIMYNTWINDIQKHLNLPDFSPHSQDIACMYLISERNCLQKLMDGYFNIVLPELAHIWASLPGAGYNQPEHSLSVVTEWYTSNGGAIIA